MEATVVSHTLDCGILKQEQQLPLSKQFIIQSTDIVHFHSHSRVTFYKTFSSKNYKLHHYHQYVYEPCEYFMDRIDKLGNLKGLRVSIKRLSRDINA